VILFAFTSTGLGLDIRFDVPEEQVEVLVSYFCKAVEDVMNLDQEPIEQAALRYRQAREEDQRELHWHSICTKYEDILMKHYRILATRTARFFTKLMVGNVKIENVCRGPSSFGFSFRCKSTDGLLELQKLIASGELYELCGSITLSCINQPMPLCYRMSLTADAG